MCSRIRYLGIYEVWAFDIFRNNVNVDENRLIYKYQPRMEKNYMVIRDTKIVCKHLRVFYSDMTL